MRRSVFLALCALSAGCELPIRDNPIDPENRPVVVLRAFVGATEASVARRNTPFTFDATGSSDPDNRTLSFDWDFDGDLDYDDPVADFPGLTFASNGAVATVALPISASDFPPTANGEGLVTRTVHLRVRAGDSKVGAEILVGVTNERPSVDVGEEIAVPAGLGQTVTLDACAATTPCASFDPDDDILSGTDFVWTQIGGTDVSASLAAIGTSGKATFTAPLSEGVLAFRLVASDGIASASARQIVRVGPQAWARTDERLYRLRTEQRFNSLSVAVSGTDVVAVDATTGDIWVAGYNMGGGTDVRRFSTDGTLLNTCFIPSNGAKSMAAFGGAAVVAHEDGFTRCSNGSTETPITTDSADAEAVVTDGTTVWYLTRTKLYRGDLASNAPSFVDSVPGGGQFSPAEMTLDASGVPWVSSSNGIFQLEPDDELDVRASGNFIRLAPHPDSGVWAIDESGTQDYDLVRITEEDGSVSQAAIGLGGDPLLVAENITRTLWVMDGVDLLRFDLPGDELLGPEAFDATAELSAATDERVEFRSLAADPVHGAVAVGAHMIDLFTGIPNNGRLAIVHPALHATRAIPGVSPDDNIYVDTRNAMTIDPLGRGLWFRERNPEGLSLFTEDGRRVIVAFGSDHTVAGPFPTLSGGLYALYYDIFGDQTFGILTATPDGALIPALTIDLSPETIRPVFAGNETGICAVGETSISTGYPLRVDPATGVKTSFASSVIWDPYHVPEAAISRDGGTCWYIESEAVPKIVTASGMTATRTNVSQQTTAIAADPRPSGGVWRADSTGAITRFAGGAGSLTAVATPVTALAIERVCDTAADANCVNVWYAFPGAVVRAKTNGTVIETFKMPGVISDLTVR